MHSDTTLVATDSAICFYGQAKGLEPSIASFLLDSDANDNCTATNGCGVHVHSGTGCGSSEEQQGHLFATEVDPWLLVGYTSTDDTGTTSFVDCVQDGINATDYLDRPFIVHANDGSRVSCGLISTPPWIGDDDEVEESASSVLETSVLLVSTMLSVVVTSFFL